MTVRKKTLATSFDNVANDNDIKKDIKENTNTNITNKYSENIISDVKTNINKVNNNNDNKYSDTSISDMIGHKSSKPTKRMVGVYFDEDVANNLDTLKKKGKLNVSKSEFINVIVRKALEDNGLM